MRIACVKLEIPGGGFLYVNPALVGAVQALPDRPTKCQVTVGATAHRVLGSPAATLERLNWAEALAAPPLAGRSAGPPPAPTPASRKTEEGLEDLS